MQISPVNNNLSNQTFCRRKIPRYLYHLTSAKKYESMVKDGFIRTSDADGYTNCVFTIELENFFKKWRQSKDGTTISLQDKLIRHVAAWSDNLVMLKIPTDALAQSKLKVRSLDILFGHDALADSSIELGRRNVSKKSTELLSTPDVLAHVQGNTPATSSKKYKNKGASIEFLYGADIPLTQVEKVGEVNIRELKKAPDYNPREKMHNIFTHLLSGCPEYKSAKRLDC